MSEPGSRKPGRSSHNENHSFAVSHAQKDLRPKAWSVKTPGFFVIGEIFKSTLPKIKIR